MKTTTARFALAAVALLGIAAPHSAPAAAPVSVECYALVVPGKSSSCEVTFNAPRDIRPDVHAALHVGLPTAGTLRLDWIGYSGQALATWDCNRAGVVLPDTAANTTGSDCERTDHANPIVPFNIQRLRVTASATACLDYTGPVAACSAHGKLTFH